MGHSIELGIAKVNKYASRESGDTAEVVERPGGGISVVVVDGQGSGAAAKALSLMLTAKAITLLKEGVRDGAVARGARHVACLSRRESLGVDRYRVGGSQTQQFGAHAKWDVARHRPLRNSNKCNSGR